MSSHGSPPSSAVCVPRYASITAGSAPTDVRRTFGDDPPFGHAHDPVADAHDDVHVVLDEHDRHPFVAQLGDVTEQRLHQRGVHAGHRLVEHDEVRLGHEGTGHLQELALPARERGGVVVLALASRKRSSSSSGTRRARPVASRQSQSEQAR